MKGLVVGGTNSGVGKTTVATGIMAALSRRGFRVQPFKVGPDYIDPSYHSMACGAASRNLDSWLLEEPVLAELFQRAVGGKDVAVVEGVMGLYDGFKGDSEEGSTAQIARMLRLPVVLVVDAGSAARSVGATVLGFRLFDPDLDIAGVIFNGIAGDSHLEFVRSSMSKSGVPILGYMPRRPDLVLPERHLGLVPTMEGAVAGEFFGRLAAQVEKTVDLDRILSLHQAGPASAGISGIFPEKPVPAKVSLAVACDKAFNFYYEDSLDLLQAWGAEIVRFSPLNDSRVPEGVGGIYLGGGFPEVYARELAENRAMMGSLRDAAADGMPIYAECGGLMYLGQDIEDREGRVHPMAGIVPARSFIRDTRLTLGYRTARALVDSPLLKAGEQVRGHEFHLSSLKEQPQAGAALYELSGLSRVEGFYVNNVAASYVHLHLGGKKTLAPRFADYCARWRSTR